MPLGRPRDRLADAAHPAPDEPPAAGALVLAHQVVEEHVGGTRRPRPREGADRAVVGEDRLELVRLEVPVQEVADALGHEVDEPEELVAELPELPEEPDHLLDVGRPPGHRVRRSLPQELAHELGRVVEERLEHRIGLGVLPRELGDLGARLLGVVPVDEVPSVREGHEQVIGRQDLIAELPQLELLDDLGLEQTHDVRGGRHAVSGPDLLGHAGPTQHAAALQDERPKPGPGEVRGADEPVVPGTDDDRVVDLGHGGFPGPPDPPGRPATGYGGSLRGRKGRRQPGPRDGRIRASDGVASSCWTGHATRRVPATSAPRRPRPCQGPSPASRAL